MCADTPSTERPDPADYVGWKIVEWGRGNSQLLEAPNGQRRRVEVFTFEAVARLNEQLDLYRVKHAELEAEVARLRAENESLSGAVREAIERELAIAQGTPLANGRYPHLTICSADTRKPLGESGCVCAHELKRHRATIARLTEQVDLYRVKHAELEAEVERLRKESRYTQSQNKQAELDRLRRAAASPVAVDPAEDAFLNLCEPGEVRT